MGINLWSNAPAKSIRLGNCHSESKWRMFWRKIKREKNKKFSRNSSIPPSKQASYDMDSYAQNFDRGSGWAEPENRFRSFSARFAVTSEFLEDNNFMDRY